jgi:hypothetical protein
MILELLGWLLHILTVYPGYYKIPMLVSGLWSGPLMGYAAAMVSQRVIL